MAILGKTTLISGECYNDFITKGKQLIGTSSVLSNIPGPSSDSNPLQVNGYAVANGFKINGLTNADEYLLLADGSYISTVMLVNDLTPENYVKKTGDIMTGHLQFNIGYDAATTPRKVGSIYINTDGISLEGTYFEFGQSIIEAKGYIKGSQLNMTGQITANRCNSTEGFFQTSDIRKKENLKNLDLNKCYELIDKCQTVLFDYKEGAKDQMGMIAQEVEEFFPEIVATDEKGFKSLDYAKLTVVILRVLKDLIKKVNGYN